MRGCLPGDLCRQPDLQHQRSAGEVCDHTGFVQHTALRTSHGVTGCMRGTGGRGAWAALTPAGPDCRNLARCACRALLQPLSRACMLASMLDARLALALRCVLLCKARALCWAWSYVSDTLSGLITADPQVGHALERSATAHNCNFRMRQA